MGRPIRNAKRTAPVRSYPSDRAVVIATPERLAPGNRAKHCPKPKPSVCRKDKSVTTRFAGARLSTCHKATPKIIRHVAIIPIRSPCLSRKDSNDTAKSDAGTAVAIIRIDTFASFVHLPRPVNALTPAFEYLLTSLQRHIRQPTKVPRCRATSKVFSSLGSPAKSFHPSNHGTASKCPLEDTGMNSVRP